jgi:hypothetical protein
MKKHLLHILFILFTVNAVAQNGKTFIKNQFKQLFLTNAEDLFTYLGDAKIQQLFLVNGISEIRDANHFKSLLNNNVTFRNNALKFIKTE